MDIMVESFTVEELGKFWNQFFLVGGLMLKIQRERAVWERWLPEFSPKLVELAEFLNSRRVFEDYVDFIPVINEFPGNISSYGQWIVACMNLRFYNGVSDGISLSNLIV